MPLTRQAWDQIANEEATGLAKMLEQPGRKVMVLIIAHDEATDVVALARAISDGSTANNACGFLSGVERAQDMLSGMLVRHGQ